MSFKLMGVSALAASLAAAAPAPLAAPAPNPAPQATTAAVPTATIAVSEYMSASSYASSLMMASIGPASQDPYTLPLSSISVEPIISSQVTGMTSHGPYMGPAPTVTGAPMSGPAAQSIPAKGPASTATYYNTNGGLTQEEPAPYTPAGGLGTDGTLPRYMVESDFDFESIALGLYQEWIELDLFHNGLAVFSDQDFIDAGLNAEDRSYIEFMADQEAGHATLLTNMLGEAAPPQCTYNYPYTTVREFVDFCQRLTRWGESGVWGFINHLDAREVGQLLAQSIATEARQQMSFRQMSGLTPQDVWFETGIPQSWAWTYLAPYISACPAGTTRLAWQNFPTLHITNNPNINRIHPNNTGAYEVSGRRVGDPSNSTLPKSESCNNPDLPVGYACDPAIAHNRSEPLSFAGKQIFFEWDAPNMPVGPNNSYLTATSSGDPMYALFVAQLNATYVPLTMTGPNSGYAFQPNSTVYAGDPQVNGTMFIALTDTDLPVTPFNLSMVNPHVRALGLYQAG